MITSVVMRATLAHRSSFVCDVSGMCPPGRVGRTESFRAILAGGGVAHPFARFWRRVRQRLLRDQANRRRKVVKTPVIVKYAVVYLELDDPVGVS